MIFHRFKYHKLILLILAIIIAYLVFRNPNVNNFILYINNNFGYFGIFIAGMLFAFGFTAPFAVGFFIVSNYSNILIAGLIGGFGAMISNLLMFNFIRISFRDELKRLEKIKLIKEIEYIVDKEFNKKVRLYLLYILVGILIASPLPDEVADMILGGFTKINPYIFAILSFVLSVIGITLLLMI